ncbi:hypothetical protein NGRA_1673 [Nosema granulosis]|uniref:Uncharacterized protein n=1 Tax=Nosema granulosis TaxID=83296 RepID=A0A9P6GZ06_9MICR|nr:hypothetical protein NGRA_1673 [Nosema granulosis]
MNIFLWLSNIVTLSINERILSYKVEKYPIDGEFNSLEKNPEAWNVEIHSIDMYSFFTSKSPVPFIVKHSEDGKLEICIFVENLDEFVASNIVFYLVAYPLKKPDHVYRTSIYKLVIFGSGDTYLTKVEYNVVLFLCHMAYLYRDVVEINIEDFPESKYRTILGQHTFSSYSIPKKFIEEIPLRNHHSDIGLIDFIRDCLLHYTKICAQRSMIKSLQKLLYVFSDNNMLVVRNMCHSDFSKLLFFLNTDLKSWILDYKPVEQKLLEIYGRKLQQYQNETCCYL